MNVTYTLKVLADPEQAAKLAAGEWRELGVALWSNTTNTQARYMPILGMEAASGETSQPLKMLDTLNMPATVLPALQVANIAVSAAGFAMVLHKLGELDHKLDNILSHLSNIGQDVRWVREILDADLLARIKAITYRLSIPALDDPIELRAALRDLIDASEILNDRRALLFTNGQALSEGRLLGLYSDYLSHCIQLQLSTCWRLDDPESAIKIGRNWTERLSETADRLIAPIRAGTDSIAHLALFASLPEDRRKTAEIANTTLRHTVIAIEHQTERLTLFAEHGVRPADLAAINAAHPDQLILLEFSNAPPE